MKNPNFRTAHARQSLNSISPVGAWETNEKTLNTIFLNTAFVDVAPSAAQISQILQIAQLCSADAGPVVFRARNWYHTLTGIQVEVNCYGVMERSDNDGMPFVSSALVISPNPAQDRLLIVLPMPIKGDGKIEIFDLSGKQKLSVDMPNASKEVDISTLGLSNGIYFCRLIENGQIINTAKFSVQH